MTRFSACAFRSFSMSPAGLMALALSVSLIGCGDRDEDEDTREDTTDSTSEVEPVAPSAHISIPDEITVNIPVTFDGSASSAPEGVELVAWDWSCSDGSTASGEQVEFSFSSAGSLTCDLTVTTDAGAIDQATTDATVASEKLSWTVMVFINGDNNLEDAGLDDVNELEQVGSSDEVNLLVQFDRSLHQSQADGDWSGARRYRVEADDMPYRITSPVLEDLGAVDSGDWRTVVDFVEWSAENYPAERYALVIWNHGEGWRSGSSNAENIRAISLDDNTGNYLSIANGDLADLLSETNEIIDGSLDLLGMDACLMQTWEVASDASPYADVFVASQEVEGYDGWPYDTSMADLVANPDMDAEALGSAITQRFEESGEPTQSAIDLGQMRNVSEAIDSLASELLQEDNARTLLRIAGSSAWSSYYNEHNRDLGMVLDALADTATASDEVVEAALHAREALDSSVISNDTANGYGALSGLSIYLPTSGGVDNGYQRGSWAESNSWDELLEVLD